MPEYADFSSVRDGARYYVSAVTLGRAVALAFESREGTLGVEAGARYEGWRAGVASRVSRGEVVCHIATRGVRSGLACGPTGVPTVDELVAARNAATSEPASVIFVELRRLPGSVTGSLTPTSIRLTGVAVERSTDRCYDVLGNAPDLRVRWEGGEVACPDDSRSCSLSAELPAAGVVPLEVTDLDISEHDRCGIVNVVVPPVSAEELAQRPPGPATLTIREGAVSITVQVDY